MKLSFLMAAHNEEKIIAKTLSNLISLPYKNYEVILGLDGCTDKTEEIVKSFEKKSNKIRHFNLNIRSGKPAVINSIIKHAKGEIIIINDADWIFQVKDEKILSEFLSAFNNPEVGGIAEAFPVEWDESKLKHSNFGYKMVAYSSFFWLEFQKNKFTTPKDNLSLITSPTMFLTDIFRKKLYKPNTSLGDDFERTHDIMNSNHNIALFNNPNLPRFIATYNKISIKDLFKQKVRTAIARNQLTKKSQGVGMNYYLGSVPYLFFNSWKFGFVPGFAVSFWILLTFFATLVAKFQNKSTKEGWKMRVNRA
jgi:glycosyltransferase involved in cell wall biosynthesis